jgi:hypothetical protein
VRLLSSMVYMASDWLQHHVDDVLGVRVKEHYGNFFIRSNDLLAVPNIDRDKAIGVHLEVSEPKELAALLSRGIAHVSIQVHA